MQEQIQTFREQGFVVVPGFVSQSRCAMMKQIVQYQLEEVIEPLEYEVDLHYPGAPESKDAPGGRTIRRLVNAYDRHPVFADWATSYEVRKWLAQYYGEAPHLVLSHHNTVFTKHPKYGSLTEWHRDSRHWKFKSDDLVNVWLAIGDEREDSGVLWFIPGSHHMDIAPYRFTPSKFLRADLPENEMLLERAVWPSLKTGDAIFFHANTLHAAGKNTTNEVKQSLVFTYHGASNAALPGTRSASKPVVIF